MSNGTFSVQIKTYYWGRQLHSYRCVFPGSHCFPFRLLNTKANTQSFLLFFIYFLHGAAGQHIAGAPSPKQVKIARVFHAASYFWIGATEVYTRARAQQNTSPGHVFWAFLSPWGAAKQAESLYGRACLRFR